MTFGGHLRELVASLIDRHGLLAMDLLAFCADYAQIIVRGRIDSVDVIDYRQLYVQFCFNTRAAPLLYYKS